MHEYRHDRFYLVMPVLLLTFVIIGFSRSFYLQTAFDFPELPWHLHAHGAILSIWFVVAALQPWLIRNRRFRAHRRLGVSAVALAVAVIAISVWTVAQRDAPTIVENPSRGAGNLASLFMFAACLTFALMLRKRPNAHKRLMLLASIPLAAPALDRIGRIPAVGTTLEPFLSWFDAPVEVAVATVGFLVLVATVVISDLVILRRVHIGTWTGLFGIFVVAPVLTIATTSTGLWAMFVTASSSSMAVSP